MASNKIDKLLGSLNESYIEFGLDRILAVLRVLGNPQESIKTIHIAGTNGKGSTAYCIYKLLTAQGYKTGLYTSPHINSVFERFVWCGRLITENELCSNVKAVLNAAKKEGISLTFFEVLTAAAFLFYKNNNADYLVLETGLGGRLDATNVVKKPEAVIITSISRDHMEYLGNSLSSIVLEKSAIIKEHVPVVIGNVPKDALKVLLKSANEKRSSAYVFSKHFKCKNIRGLKNKAAYGFDYSGLSSKLNKIEINGINFAQSKNISMALCCCEILFGGISENFKRVLRGFSVNGRSSIASISCGSDKYEAVFDGGHNPEAVQNLICNLSFFYPARKKIFVLNFMKDKEYEKNLGIILPHADEIIVKKIHSKRAASAEMIAGVIKKSGYTRKVSVIDSIGKSVLNNISCDSLIVFCGSFYLLGEIERELKHERFSLSWG